jgi:hypothetical protein
LHAQHALRIDAGYNTTGCYAGTGDLFDAGFRLRYIVAGSGDLFDTGFRLRVAGTAGGQAQGTYL